MAYQTVDLLLIVEIEAGISPSVSDVAACAAGLIGHDAGIEIVYDIPLSDSDLSVFTRILVCLLAPEPV
jgi:hypothetical protein